jgi:hypothetical protein
MVQLLSERSVNCWAVTGTPVFRKSINDLGILLNFVGREPYRPGSAAWSRVVAAQEDGNWTPLVEALQPTVPPQHSAGPIPDGGRPDTSVILWRDASNPDVERALNLPQLRTELILVPMTTVEASCLQRAEQMIGRVAKLSAKVRNERMQSAVVNPVRCWLLRPPSCRSCGYRAQNYIFRFSGPGLVAGGAVEDGGRVSGRSIGVSMPTEEKHLPGSLLDVAKRDHKHARSQARARGFVACRVSLRVQGHARAAESRTRLRELFSASRPRDCAQGSHTSLTGAAVSQGRLRFLNSSRGAARQRAATSPAVQTSR